MARRKRIKKPEIPDTSTIPKPNIPSTNGFNFYSVYQWLGTTNKFSKSDNFTNCCKSKEDFADDMIYIFEILIPTLYREHNDIFKHGNPGRQYPHCHTVSDEKIEICIKISEELHQRKFSDFKGDTVSWWQIGITRGMRVFGLFDDEKKSFYPLFIDRHHLVSPNEKYNDQDYQSFSYNPLIDK